MGGDTSALLPAANMIGAVSILELSEQLTGKNWLELKTELMALAEA